MGSQIKLIAVNSLLDQLNTKLKEHQTKRGINDYKQLKLSFAYGKIAIMLIDNNGINKLLTNGHCLTKSQVYSHLWIVFDLLYTTL